MIDEQKAFQITPSLWMGPPSEAVWISDLEPVTSANEAFHRIREGMRALLPPGSWTMAREVLQRLGCEKDWIDELFYRASGDW